MSGDSNVLLTITPKLSWYVARSSGIVVWILVTMSILWGLALSSRLLRGRATPGWVLDLHRYLGGISVVFVGVHIGGLVADNYVHFGWADILLPMQVTWRPGAVAWGIAGFYALVAIEVTSLLRTRIPRRVWRLAHYLSMPLFVACTVHGLQAGKDSGNRMYVALTVLGVSAVTVLGLIRIALTRGARTSSPERYSAAT